MLITPQPPSRGAGARAARAGGSGWRRCYRDAALDRRLDASGTAALDLIARRCPA